MSETLYEFNDGPYDILNFTVKTDSGKVVIELNDGDLGRIPIESAEAVDHLREALDHAEAHFRDVERRQEEL